MTDTTPTPGRLEVWRTRTAFFARFPDGAVFDLVADERYPALPADAVWLTEDQTTDRRCVEQMLAVHGTTYGEDPADVPLERCSHCHRPWPCPTVVAGTTVHPAAEPARDALTTELTALRAELERVCAIKAEIIDRDGLAINTLRGQLDDAVALLSEILVYFSDSGYPGEPCKRTSWVKESRLAAWHERRRALASLAPTDSVSGPAPEPTDDVIEQAALLLHAEDACGNSPHCNGYCHDLARRLAAAGLLRGSADTVIHAPHPADTLKMIRETLCVAQTHVNLHVADTDRRQAHSDRIGRLIDDIDRQRPLGPDGKHGDLHTPTCGCEDR